MKRNRDTLKKFFEKGALPSADQFADLIDSGLNMIDEGFSKTEQNGFEVASLGESDRLISFFRTHDRENYLWSISFNQEQDSLVFNTRLPDLDTMIARGDGGTVPQIPVLALSRQGRVGINKTNPQAALDVGGAVRAHGRIGAFRQGRVNADGTMHDITGELQGCHAFEIIAGAAGKRGSGKYALMRAIAMNTFNPSGLFFNFLNRKKGIKCHHAYYRSANDKLKLRWAQVKGEDADRSKIDRKYCLMLGSHCDYGDHDAQISYHITRLWFDEDMSECRRSGEDDGDF